MKPAKPESLILRHVGGDLSEVDIEEAHPSGFLFVRWRGAVGARAYALHVFRTIEGRGSGLLFKTEVARVPLLWAAFDVEKAREIWRRRTGRKQAREWIRVWRDGKAAWVEKEKETP